MITNVMNLSDITCLSSYSKKQDIKLNNNSDNTRSNTRDCVDKNESKAIPFIVNIYRYKFTDEFMEELYKFAKIHQYDHRKDFKEAWEIWVDDNKEIVDEESRRLINLGYDGDVVDKMFKSTRYYFRKKNTHKKEPTKRRDYVGSQKELLEAMENHIKSYTNEFKPSDGFKEFCQTHKDLVKDQIARLIRAGIKDSDVIKEKIKKTYKNRYFLMIKSFTNDEKTI